jgi:O-antigen ligase
MINHEGEGRDGNRVRRPTTIGSQIANPPVAAASAGRWDSGSLRDTLFLVTFLLLWLTVTPFVDLGRSDVLDVNTGGSLATMVASLGLTAALAMFLVQTGSLQALRGAASPALIVTLAWFAISAVLSDNADLAIRRLVLAVITLFQACAFLMLPRDLRHFARLLTIGALIVVAFCYFGVLFLPHLSIHQATDFAEPGLAGDWRGTFRHKNDAGGDMAIFIFIGLFATLCWVVLQPLSDLVRARDVDADLQLFFMRVWFFGLCLSSFESLLFAVGRTQWFMMTVAIFGLRLQTLSRLKR